MSDGETVDAGAFLERLTQVGGTEVCPVCSTRAWWTLGLGEDLSALHFANGRSVATYGRLCGNCGLAQQFVKAILDGEVKIPGPKASE